MKSNVFRSISPVTVSVPSQSARAGAIGTLTGYALVWHVLSDDRGGYKVRLAPGSAKFAAQVHALRHHDYRDPLGDLHTRTLRIFPDSYGVKVEIDLPNTSVGRDMIELVRAQRVKGMSFSMVSLPWTMDGYGRIAEIPGKSRVTIEQGEKIATALAYTVGEVTVTAAPSFIDTTIDVKPAAATTKPAYATEAERNRLEFFRIERARLDVLRWSLRL